MTNKQLSIILRIKDEASKRLKGVRGNLQRFANSWKKNWLAITAAITASIMAVRKAWDLMELGARADQQARAFKNLADAHGTDSKRIIADMKRLSGETLSTSQVMEKASQAMILGIAPEKLGKLMEISRASARAFGQDTNFMFESIVIGIGRQSKLILDNLGIIVSAGAAYSKYAKLIGKSTKQLTEQERKQAFLNATLEAGERILKQIDTSTMTSYEKMQRLKAGWREFSEQIGQALIHVVGFMQALTNQIVSGLFTMLEVGTNVFQKLLIPLQKFYEMLSKLPGQFGATYAEAARSIDELSQKMDVNKNAFQLAAVDSAKIAMDQYDLVFAKVKETGDQTAEVLKAVVAQVGQQAEGVQTSFNAMEEFARQSARNIQTAFADFFFKAFTGELKNLKSIMASFGEAMLRMLANVLAKLMLVKALTFLGGSSGKIFGVSIGKLFHQGGMVSKYHSGGVIKAHNGLSPDEVPIIAQTGEGVLSRKGMRSVGGSDNLRRLNRGETFGERGRDVIVNITQVIKAWDAEDVYRNRKVLSSAIADEITRNAGIRGIIMRYT